MHAKGIAHRDLKVENVLRSQDNFKICDFGSSSKDILDFKEASKDLIIDSFEHYEKYTTLMYRPPEMIDQYLKFNVDLKADIWMIGCILYSLCFSKHPF
jgi:AP2-associated kinase